MRHSLPVTENSWKHWTFHLAVYDWALHSFKNIVHVLFLSIGAQKNFVCERANLLREPLNRLQVIEKLLQVHDFCGRESLEAGRESLEAGRESLEAGREPLEAGREPLEAGREPLEAGRESLEAGRESLEAGRESLEAGREPLEAGREPLEAGRQVFEA